MPVIELTNVIDGVTPWSGAGAGTVSDAEVKVAEITLTAAEVVGLISGNQVMVAGKADTVYIPLHFMLYTVGSGSDGIVEGGAAGDKLAIYRFDGANSAMVGSGMGFYQWVGGGGNDERADEVFEDSDEGEDAFWEFASLELGTTAAGGWSVAAADATLRAVLVYLEADTS